MRMSNPPAMREDGAPAEGGSENSEMEQAELRHLLHGILSRLPEEQREVLGCSQSTAKSRCRLAIERLRKEMKEDEQ